jgi:hypothetical protein
MDGALESRRDVMSPKGAQAAMEEKRMDTLKPPKKKASAILDEMEKEKNGAFA